VLSSVSGCDKGNTPPENDSGISWGSDAEVSSEAQDAPGDEEDALEYASDENLLDSMNKEEITGINAFLSSFSQAQYGTGRFYRTEDMINFAFVHNTAYSENSTVAALKGRCSIDEKLVDTTLKKFFGKTVLHETPDGAGLWKYENGKFVADGFEEESCAYFSLSTCVRELKNGNYEAEFSVFFNANGPSDEINPDWYALTASEAGQFFEFCYDGTAVIKPHNGGYTLVSYETN